MQGIQGHSLSRDSNMKESMKNQSINFSEKTCKVRFLAVFVLFLSCFFGTAQAAEKLFNLWVIPQAPGVSDGIGGLDPVQIKNTQFKLILSSVNNLSPGQQFDVPLLDGETTVVGTVQPAFTNLAGEAVQVLALSGGRGSLELTYTGGTVSGIRLFDQVQKKLYQAGIDANGDGTFVEGDPNSYECIDYPLPAAGAALGQPEVSALIPDLSTLQHLESRPGSPNVLYINYWGGVLPGGTAWSADPIPYQEFGGGNDGTFSADQRYRMWLGWREASEDYAAFNINVTTDQAVFDATPKNHRVQIISTVSVSNVTPANGAGGVAYVGIFGINSDYYATGWAYNSSASSHGMTISHESGHQMGLDHDGTSSLGYYSGHGEWGPIMGAPFGKEYVQWSKGEYPDANQFENDLNIVNGKLGSVADDAGDTIATATAIGTQVTDQEGLIAPFGLAGTVDVDYYTFTLDSSAATQIQVIPTIIDDDSDEQYGTNLSMRATLLDSAENPVAGQIPVDGLIPTYNPITNILTYDGTLEAGTYYLKIEAESPDLNWSTGFGEYGNGGLYRVSVNADNSSGDTTPDPFAFVDQDQVSLETLIESNPITITGITDPATILVQNGEYSVNGQDYTSIAGSVVNEDVIRVRHTSSSDSLDTVETTLDVGGVSDTFSTKTAKADTKPDRISFAAVVNASPSTLLESSQETVSGINAPTPVSVSGGEYRINAGAYTTENGTVHNGDTVQVRHTSSSRSKGKVRTTLKVGNLSASFQSTTRSLDTKPDKISFTAALNVSPSTLIESSQETVSGINAPTPISVSGGEYRINAGVYTTQNGTVNNGDTI
ncbi:MAG TPA: hypothetical protein ENJ32_02960, partial [Crenotrichaceae bacterium]|nr:hypothetical protein [Crenotrichaceae bacterium]